MTFTIRKVGTERMPGPAVHPVTSGRIPAAGKQVPEGRTAGAAGSVLHGRPGCNSDLSPCHEDAFR